MICVPIKQNKTEALFKEFKKAQKVADFIEIWFDELSDFDLKELKKNLAKNKTPIIYKSQGYLAKINEVLSLGIELIDLDISTDKKTINSISQNFPNTKIIISSHDFKKTPPLKMLQKIANEIIKKGADIIKIATFAKSPLDSFIMLEFLSELSRKHKSICLCMGKNGLITRASGHLFGNYLMYAPLDLKSKTAEGQITAKELKEIQQLIPELCR